MLCMACNIHRYNYKDEGPPTWRWALPPESSFTSTPPWKVEEVLALRTWNRSMRAACLVLRALGCRRIHSASLTICVRALAAAASAVALRSALACMSQAFCVALGFRLM